MAIATHPTANDFFTPAEQELSKLERIVRYFRGAKSRLGDGSIILPTLSTARAVVEMADMGLGDIPVAVSVDNGVPSYRVIRKGRAA